MSHQLPTQRIDTVKAPPPVGPYPHARRVGPFLLLSGVGPRQPGTAQIPGVELNADGEIIHYDIELQCRSVMENVRLILEAAGAQWQDLIDITVFLTHMKTDFPIVNGLWREYFSDPATQPCRTTVEVTALPTPIAIELKCMAYLGETDA
jgi:2-aminomuconate deaminase